MKMTAWESCNAKTDEEFVTWYENRNRKMIIFPLLGLLAFVPMALRLYDLIG